MAATPYKIRVLLVDDDAPLLARWSRACAQSGIELSGASSLRAARRWLEPTGSPRRRFDCVLTEVNLPDGSGLDLFDQLALLEPRPALAVISAHIDNPLALLLHRRAIAFLFKPVALPDLFTLIGSLALAERPQSLLPSAPGTVGSYAEAFQLTRRERQVLDHCVAGHGREETAAALGISIGTVHRTWVRILARTGNATQDALLRHLIRHLAEVPARASTVPPPASRPMPVRQRAHETGVPRVTHTGVPSPTKPRAGEQ